MSEIFTPTESERIGYNDGVTWGLRHGRIEAAKDIRRYVLTCLEIEKEKPVAIKSIQYLVEALITYYESGGEPAPEPNEEQHQQ